MRISEIKALIKSRAVSGNKRPVMVLGAPGTGKTELAAQVAAELSSETGEHWGLIIQHCPMQQPEDNGIPVVSADKSDVSFVVPSSKYPLANSKLPAKGILVLDELPQSDNTQQKIAANVLLARDIHGFKLLDGWVIYATGNRQQDRSGAGPTLKHLDDRVTIIESDSSNDDWIKWALANNVRIEVIAFIKFRPELLNAFDPHQRKSPTARGWTKGVSAALNDNTPAKMEYEVFKGEVGEAAAAEFCAFLKIWRELPSPDQIILDPVNAPVPDDSKPSVCYALMGALARKATANNFARIMQYVKRVPSEFGALFVLDATRCKTPVETDQGKKPCKTCGNCQLAKTREFIEWASTDGQDLLT